MILLADRNNMTTKLNSKMILLIRAIHGIITLFYLICIVDIFYVGISNQTNSFVYIAVGFILFEGLIIRLNKGNCPLGVIHQKYGDDKTFFEVILPKPIAKQAVPFLFIITFIGFLLLVF